MFACQNQTYPYKYAVDEYLNQICGWWTFESNMQLMNIESTKWLFKSHLAQVKCFFFFVTQDWQFYIQLFDFIIFFNFLLFYMIIFVSSMILNPYKNVSPKKMNKNSHKKKPILIEWLTETIFESNTIQCIKEKKCLFFVWFFEIVLRTIFAWQFGWQFSWEKDGISIKIWYVQKAQIFYFCLFSF